MDRLRWEGIAASPEFLIIPAGSTTSWPKWADFPHLQDPRLMVSPSVELYLFLRKNQPGSFPKYRPYAFRDIWRAVVDHILVNKATFFHGVDRINGHCGGTELGELLRVRSFNLQQITPLLQTQVLPLGITPPYPADQNPSAPVYHAVRPTAIRTPHSDPARKNETTLYYTVANRENFEERQRPPGIEPIQPGILAGFACQLGVESYRDMTLWPRPSSSGPQASENPVASTSAGTASEANPPSKVSTSGWFSPQVKEASAVKPPAVTVLNPAPILVAKLPEVIAKLGSRHPDFMKAAQKLILEARRIELVGNPQGSQGGSGASPAPAPSAEMGPYQSGSAPIVAKDSGDLLPKTLPPKNEQQNQPLVAAQDEDPDQDERELVRDLESSESEEDQKGSIYRKEYEIDTSEGELEERDGALNLTCPPKSPLDFKIPNEPVVAGPCNSPSHLGHASSTTTSLEGREDKEKQEISQVPPSGTKRKGPPIKEEPVDEEVKRSKN